MFSNQIPSPSPRYCLWRGYILGGLSSPKFPKRYRILQVPHSASFKPHTHCIAFLMGVTITECVWLTCSSGWGRPGKQVPRRDWAAGQSLTANRRRLSSHSRELHHLVPLGLPLGCTSITGLRFYPITFLTSTRQGLSTWVKSQPCHLWAW